MKNNMNETHSRKITVGTFTFKQVDSFRYLGTTVDRKNKRSMEIA